MPAVSVQQKAYQSEDRAMESSDAEVATYPDVKRFEFRVDYPEGGAMGPSVLKFTVQPHHRTTEDRTTVFVQASLYLVSGFRQWAWQYAEDPAVQAKSQQTRGRRY
jgi:hypothetical protein